MRDQLAAKYREAGKPVVPEAMSVTPLEVVSHTLIVRDAEQDFLLYETNRRSKLTTQTVAFWLPEVAGASRLHRRLSVVPDAIQLVLRAGYRFDRISGLTVERRAINTSFKKVVETVVPNSAARPDALLVDHNAEQWLHGKLLAEVLTVIKNYGLTPAEEREALDEIGKIKMPSSPMTIQDLLQLEENSLMLTVNGVQVEAKPATNDEAITKLKEARLRSEQLAEAAEKISDLANDETINDRKFHSESRRAVINAGQRPVSSRLTQSANMHWDKDDSDIKDNHLQEIRKGARMRRISPRTAGASRRAMSARSRVCSKKAKQSRNFCNFAASPLPP